MLHPQPCGPTPPLPSDRLDAEVQPDEREGEALQVLHEVVEGAQALGVLALLHIEQRANLGRRKRNVLVAQDDLELLPPIPVGLGPVLVVLPARQRRARQRPSAVPGPCAVGAISPNHLALLDDAPQLVQDGGPDVDCSRARKTALSRALEGHGRGQGGAPSFLIMPLVSFL